MKKSISFIFKTTFYLPLIWLIFFVSYVSRVAVKIGRLPEYDNPQSGLLYTGHFDLVGTTLDLVAIIALITLVGLLLNIRLKIIDISKRNIYLWVIGLVGIILLFVLNPLDLMRWFLD